MTAERKYSLPCFIKRYLVHNIERVSTRTVIADVLPIPNQYSIEKNVIHITIEAIYWMSVL